MAWLLSIRGCVDGVSIGGQRYDDQLPVRNGLLSWSGASGEGSLSLDFGGLVFREEEIFLTEIHQIDFIREEELEEGLCYFCSFRLK